MQHQDYADTFTKHTHSSLQITTYIIPTHVGGPVADVAGVAGVAGVAVGGGKIEQEGLH